MILHNKAVKTIVFTILVLIAISYIYPLLAIANISLKSRMEYLNDPVSLVSKLELMNFSKAWEGANMSTNLLNSLAYTILSGIFLAIFTVLVAFPLARRKIAFHTQLMAIITGSLILPPALVPLYSIMKGLHLTDTYYGMIMFYIGSGFAFSVFILTGFMSLIPKELDEAASIDGCGYFRYVFQIVFPLSRSAMATVFMLNALHVWNDFVYPYLFISRKNMRTLSTGLFNFVGQFQSDTSVLAAAVVITAIPITIIYIVLQRQITESLVQGAVKS